mgnify:CR=1 FL=1
MSTDIINLLIEWVVMAVSLIIVSLLPTGVEIEGFKKSLVAAAVFGLLNALVRPAIKLFILPATLILNAALITLILNMIIFGLAAWLVQGFRLRWGFWSALLGSICFVFIRSFLMQFIS